MGIGCEHEWVYDPSRLALSYPPQSYYKCIKCGISKVVSVVSADVGAEYWSPTCNLRWFRKSVPLSEVDSVYRHVLQQEYRSNLGGREWRDVEKFEI